MIGARLLIEDDAKGTSLVNTFYSSEYQKDRFKILPAHEILDQLDTVLNVFYETLRHYPEGSHPMSILSAMVVSLSNFYREHAGSLDDEETRVTINRLMGKMPTIAAFSYRQSLGLPIVYPRADLSYSENFLPS